MRETYRRLIANSAATEVSGVSAAVLAAGEGRRLSPLTSILPKPLLPILNVPICLWAFASLRRAGIGEVCVNVHYRKEAFDGIARICDAFGPRLRLVHEATLSGPLGGLLSCRPVLPEADCCLVLSGDAIQSVDFHALVEFHRHGTCALTLCVTSVSDATRYGVLDIDSNGYVIGMKEKPSVTRAVELISCGIYVISTAKLAMIDRIYDRPQDFVDLVTDMLRGGEPVGTFRIDDWQDIGTPEDLLAVNLGRLNPKNLAQVAYRAPGASSADVWVADASMALPAGVTFEGTVLIGSDATIEPGARITNSVLGEGVTLMSGSQVIRSVVLTGARVAAKDSVSDCVVASQ